MLSGADAFMTAVQAPGEQQQQLLQNSILALLRKRKPGATC